MTPDYMSPTDIARIEQRRRKRDRLPDKPEPAYAYGGELRAYRPLSEFLTAEDVERLTGYRQPMRQRGWFEKNGIEFKTNLSTGRPVVHISAIDKSWRPPDPEPCAPPPIPPLDQKAAFRPLSEIRLWRTPWRPGCGPNGSGVYFLFVGFVLTYIGQSKALCWRLRAHAMNRVDRKTRLIPYNLWSAIEVHEHWLDDVEDHYIAEHQPPFNIRGIRRDS